MIAIVDESTLVNIINSTPDQDFKTRASKVYKKIQRLKKGSEVYLIENHVMPHFAKNENIILGGAFGEHCVSKLLQSLRKAGYKACIDPKITFYLYD